MSEDKDQRVPDVSSLAAVDQLMAAASTHYRHCVEQVKGSLPIIEKADTGMGRAAPWSMLYLALLKAYSPVDVVAMLTHAILAQLAGEDPMEDFEEDLGI